MKQIVQTLRTGDVKVVDVPIPTLHDSFVLVQNKVSVISAGTEKTKIDIGKKSLIQKAKARPDLVKQVINKIRTEGVAKTFQTVNTRLNTPSPLGYSSSGSVISVGGLVEGIVPGDRVACAGAGFANHAELVAVPKNLLVKVPKNVSDEEAAFTTLGSIALQGVRLAEPKLGETFLVLGLGLIGQISVQLLRANGCIVIGTDLDPTLVSLSQKYGAIGIKPEDDVSAACSDLTGRHGVDGVLVCAGTSSNQPIELCGDVIREKGRAIIIGAVRMDIPRENFFKKEINVLISRSYGPGRYDPLYEEGGHDYPYGYVRFTEQRNMETFLWLIANGQLDITSLITHRFGLDEAVDAYQLIEGKKTEPYLGIVLNYSTSITSAESKRRIVVNTRSLDKSKLGVSFFGAGNYATAILLPIIKGFKNVELRGLITSSGRTAHGVGKQFGFSYCSDDFSDLIDSDTDVVVITSRHDTHADSVVKSLNKGKHVYVEKPLAMTMEELSIVDKAYRAAGGLQLMVGFNRRFSPCTQKIIRHFGGVKSPLIVNIRVNAGYVASSHWIQNPVIGGGRMIGEGCHFVDLASAITGGNPCKVFAVGSTKLEKSALLNDNLCITLEFDNGSVANITYSADGAKAMPKEYVEVFGGGRSAQLHDFKAVVLYRGDTEVKRKKLGTQDKGQRAMLDAWVSGLRSGKPCIDYACMMTTSMASIMAVESISTGMPMNVDLAVLEHVDRSK